MVADLAKIMLKNIAMEKRMRALRLAVLAALTCTSPAHARITEINVQKFEPFDRAPRNARGRVENEVERYMKAARDDPVAKLFAR